MAAEPYAVPARATRGELARFGALALPTAALALVLATAFSNGAYFPTAWGPTALALLAAAVVSLVASRPVALSRLDVLFLAGLVALAAWTTASLAWTQSVPATVHEVERLLVYVAGALALLVATRREALPRLLGGLLAGIVAACGYALSTRLFPERLGSVDPIAEGRLAEPLGYWNALGLLAALGMLVALAASTRAQGLLARAAAAATLPVLAATAYFTFSRGSWAALAGGLVVAVALERRRLRTVGAIVAHAPAPALAVLFCAYDGNGRTQSLAATIALLSLVSALAPLALRGLERRIHVGGRARRAIGAALLVLAVATCALAGQRVVTGFGERLEQRGDVSTRLLDSSGNGRLELWAIAWDNARANPLLGSGAGSYEHVFLAERTRASLNVRDAHSLYLETLSELGPVGLALLAAALAVPLAAAVRARRSRFVPLAAGGYVAFLAHAGWDWDWEVPAVTLVALALAASVLAAARAENGRTLRVPVRLVLGAAAVAVAAAAAVSALGERATADAARAIADGDWAHAAERARTARALAPWAAEPLRSLAHARLADGDSAGAASAFRAALERDPHNVTLWLDLALVTEGAMRAHALERARALDPVNPEIPTH